MRLRIEIGNWHFYPHWRPSYWEWKQVISGPYQFGFGIFLERD